MTERSAISEHTAGRQTKPESRTWRALWDVALVGALALASFMAGFTINRFSSQPLPIVYQTPEQRFDKELTTLVTAAPFAIAPAATVGLPDFRAVVENKGALILDARPSVLFERGHVPGALNLSRDDFARDYRNLAPTMKSTVTKPIIVYCSGGTCHDSRLVANALLSLGISDVSIYTGGWDEWTAAHLPEATGSTR
jgi:rhodanese-related sulfurtransferase